MADNGWSKVNSSSALVYFYLSSLVTLFICAVTVIGLKGSEYGKRYRHQISDFRRHIWREAQRGCQPLLLFRIPWFDPLTTLRKQICGLPVCTSRTRMHRYEYSSSLLLALMMSAGFMPDWQEMARENPENQS